MQQMFQKPRRSHKDALQHKALCRIQPQRALQHWMCDWIYMGNYCTRNFLFPFLQHWACLHVAQKRNAIASVESDKMEHNISDIAWIEEKKSARARSCHQKPSTVGREGWRGRVGEYLGCILQEIVGATDWLGDIVGFDWLYKYAF